jgi:hypothetical protein
MTKKKANPQLLVVFDTNVLFTKVASDLLRQEVRSLIEENSSHGDLNIKWFLPEVVLEERRYQMQEKAFDLLPSIEKLETLLGHKLNITKDILAQRVKEAIQGNVSDFNINVTPFSPGSVDWPSLIKRAVFREPPFDAGEKEKGFKDSVIAESFIQLVKQSPATPSVCRLAFVTKDSRLNEFLKEELKDVKNVRILSRISELENLINTLVSSVTEEFVREIAEKAEKYFFAKGNQNTLYYKEEIERQISEQCANELKACQEEGLIRENGTWWINAPVFLKKERQTIFWLSPINVETKFFRYEHENQIFSNTGYCAGLLGEKTESAPNAPNTGYLYGLMGEKTESVPGYTLGDIYGKMPTKKVEVGGGYTNIEVHWSVNITQKKIFTKPKVHKIECTGFKWNDE